MNAKRRGSLTLALSLVFFGVAVLGCRADPPKVRVPSSDFPGLLTMAGNESAPVLRGQKREGPTGSILEAGPEPSGDKGQRGARIRAVVNGEAILDEEVLGTAYQSLMGGSRTDAEKSEILTKTLEEIIDREVVIQDAIARLSRPGGQRFLKELFRVATEEFERQWLHRLMRANNQTDPDAFKAVLRGSGMPYEMIRRSWERNFIAMEYMRTKIEPQLNKIGHLQMLDYYEKHPEEFRVEDSLTWQDIFIAQFKHPSAEAARQFAESLAARAARGEDFEKLAKAHDNGDSSLRPNAEGIGNRRGEVKPVEVEEVVFRLREGEVGPVVEIPGRGYHVIRVLKRTYAGKKPFDEQVQKDLRDKLKNEVFQQEMKRIVADLKRRAVIEIATQLK